LILRDVDLQKCVIRVAKEAPLDVLRPRRRTADDVMRQYCAGIE